MRKRIEKFCLSTLLIGAFLLSGACARAQCIDENGDPDTPCPIDGGLAVLLVAGVGYGVKKYAAQSKHQPEENDSNLLP